jgi:hypothetical protein
MQGGDTPSQKLNDSLTQNASSAMHNPVSRRLLAKISRRMKSCDTCVYVFLLLRSYQDKSMLIPFSG